MNLIDRNYYINLENKRKNDNKRQSIFNIMSRQIQHSEINNLIDKKEITRNYARIGCCNRCYLDVRIVLCLF